MCLYLLKTVKNIVNKTDKKEIAISHILLCTKEEYPQLP